MTHADSGWLHRLFHPVTKHMSLAVRVGVLTTAAVAVTLGFVSTIIWFTVRGQFVSSLDEEMFTRAEAAVAAGYSPSTLRHGEVDMLSLLGMQVLVVRGGDLLTSRDGAGFPFTRAELAVSIGEEQRSARTAEIGGDDYRVVAVQAGPGEAFVLAQSMTPTHSALNRLGVVLLLCSAGGMLLAGISGWAVAQNGLRPVRRLREATDYVTRTQDLAPIHITGHDELARLGQSFNRMLRVLDDAQVRERQLIADAGHELRTPLTSLRTNLDLLHQVSADPARTLPAETHREMLQDARAQVDELSTLVGDLVELARDEPLHRDPEPVDLVDITESALERVRRRGTGIAFNTRLETSMVLGEGAELERAITNLLDNAVKWSPAAGTITVRLRDGELMVRDEGPGIERSDLAHIFDRFYRSHEARTLPGSGLGLAIVKRAAQRHGGSVSVQSVPGHGATFRLRLPLVEDHQAIHGSSSASPQTDQRA